MNEARVLVVDDNEIFRELAQFALISAGYAVEVASDASSALAAIPVFRPDLILMDIQMPGVNGVELTKRLKADPATDQIAVVAFTDLSAKGDELGLKAVGYDGYVGKPFDVMALPAQVGFWLEAPIGAQRNHSVWP